jgi:hypothetical protein
LRCVVGSELLCGCVAGVCLPHAKPVLQGRMQELVTRAAPAPLCASVYAKTQDMYMCGAVAVCWGCRSCLMHCVACTWCCWT